MNATPRNASSGLTRRDFSRATAIVSAALTLGVSGRASAQSPVDGKFALPKLPYGYDALEPVIDEQTMTIHHTKHHQGYVDKLNATIAEHPSLAGLSLNQLLSSLDTLPESARTSVRNNGGGHANHSLFWNVMQSPQKDSKPSGELARQIDAKFGSFDNFKTAFANAAATTFGSGWAWLAVGPSGLEVLSMPNQDNPIMQGKMPLLGLDVWEHAYYLKYQNRRPEYINAFWEVVNWDKIGEGPLSLG